MMWPIFMFTYPPSVKLHPYRHCFEYELLKWKHISMKISENWSSSIYWSLSPTTSLFVVAPLPLFDLLISVTDPLKSRWVLLCLHAHLIGFYHWLLLLKTPTKDFRFSDRFVEIFLIFLFIVVFNSLIFWKK